MLNILGKEVYITRGSTSLYCVIQYTVIINTRRKCLHSVSLYDQGWHHSNKRNSQFGILAAHATRNWLRHMAGVMPCQWFVLGHSSAKHWSWLCGVGWRGAYYTSGQYTGGQCCGAQCFGVLQWCVGIVGHRNKWEG